MRKGIFIAMGIVALAAATLPPAPAFAGKIKLHGSHSRQEIAGACDAAGGTAFGVGGNSGEYGCETDKGEVWCKSNGQCTGTCQACGTRQGGKSSIAGVLHPPSGVKTTGGATAPRHTQQGVNAGGFKTRAVFHRSTGPTNPNEPGGGTGPFAPPHHHRVSGSGKNMKPMLRSVSEHHFDFQHLGSGKH
jgi:hypothetical protein